MENCRIEPIFRPKIGEIERRILAPQRKTQECSLGVRLKAAFSKSKRGSHSDECVPSKSPAAGRGRGE